jgi:urease accessory protein
MIIVKEKSGNIYSSVNDSRNIDALQIEWHEVRKRILHKETKQGRAICIKFMRENPDLKEGDILYEDDKTTIAVEIIPCECIVLKPSNLREAAAVSYEIGNRHLPLFYEADELLVPYDVPLYNLLVTLGYTINIEERKLNCSFQTTVLPHLQVGMTDSLLDKIHHFTTSL